MINIPTFLRFDDLKTRGIVRNWTTLSRWIRDLEFPEGALIGSNTRVWTEDEVAAWLERRRYPKSGEAA